MLAPSEHATLQRLIKWANNNPTNERNLSLSRVSGVYLAGLVGVGYVYLRYMHTVVTGQSSVSVCGSIVQPKCEPLLRHLQQLYPGSLTTKTSHDGNTKFILMWQGTQTFLNVLCALNSQLHIKLSRMLVISIISSKVGAPQDYNDEMHAIHPLLSHRAC